MHTCCSCFDLFIVIRRNYDYDSFTLKLYIYTEYNYKVEEVTIPVKQIFNN